MNTKQVIVPQHKLDKLEAARKKLYERLPETDNPAENLLNLIELQDITQIMWELANTKWKEAK